MATAATTSATRPPPGHYRAVVALTFFLATRRCCLAFASSPSSSSVAGVGHKSSSHHRQQATTNNDAESSSSSTPPRPKHDEMIDLQSQHPKQSPSETLRSLARFCDDNGITEFDVYGDYDAAAPDESYLRRFESDVAAALGMDDAVFMPSGVMAQSIALLIHANKSRSAAAAGGDDEGGSSGVRQSGSAVGGGGGMSSDSSSSSKRATFACHRTSHLLLHEAGGYSDLLNMDAIALPLDTAPCGGPIGGSLGVEPLRLSDVEEAIARSKSLKPQNDDDADSLSTIIVELPHREVGGKLTPWDEVVKMGELCGRNGVAFHCDGARIFEAAAGYGLPLPEVAAPFDSVYISFYKGLGGISGAMLLGDEPFCSEARTWLRRFGGNLYTLLPYVVSAWSGYKTRGLGEGGDGGGGSPSFLVKRDKLRRIVASLTTEDDVISSIVTFDPKVPETNMVHGFIGASLIDCQVVIDEVASDTGVRVLSRVRAISDGEDESKLGYGCRFEWTMGDANAAVRDELFIEAWKAFSARVISRRGGQNREELQR